MSDPEQIKKDCEETGFKVCSFKIDDEECERCESKVTDFLYYRRTCYWNEEGEYWCASCVSAEAKKNREYKATDF